jgi:hypothetical protein
MKKLCLLAFLFTLVPLSGFAEDAPRLHAFGGYQYFRDGFADGDKLNGVEGAFSVDLIKHLAITSDFATASESLDRQTVRISTYTFGPSISFHSAPRLAPFAHVLVGDADAGLYAGAVNTFSASENYFVMKTGGGLDVKVNRLIAVRGFQLDWNYFHRTRESHGNDFSAAAGLVFNF